MGDWSDVPFDNDGRYGDDLGFDPVAVSDQAKSCAESMAPQFATFYNILKKDGVDQETARALVSIYAESIMRTPE